MSTKHFEVKVSTTEAFLIAAESREEAIDLAQEAMSASDSDEQGALIDIKYAVIEIPERRQDD